MYEIRHNKMNELVSNVVNLLGNKTIGFKMNKRLCFQRSLNYILQYQPNIFFFFIDSKIPNITFVKNLFLDSNVYLLLHYKASEIFLDNLLINDTIIPAYIWLKNNDTLSYEAKRLYQEMLFLRYYLIGGISTIEKELNEYPYNVIFDKQQKDLLLNRNWRFKEMKDPTHDLKYHLLTNRMNSILEEKRIAFALYQSKKNPKDIKQIGRYLSISLLTILEYVNINSFEMVISNLKYTKEYGKLIPFNWYSIQILDSLLLSVQYFLNLKDINNLNSLLLLFSWFLRRLDNKVGNYISIFDPLFNYIIQTLDIVFLKNYIEYDINIINTILLNSFIIISKLIVYLNEEGLYQITIEYLIKLLSSDWIKKCGLNEIENNKNKQRLNIKNREEEKIEDKSNEEMNLSNVIENTLSSLIVQIKNIDLSKLIIELLNQQDQLKLFNLNNIDNEQEIKLFSLFHYLSMKSILIKDSNIKQGNLNQHLDKLKINNPFIWKPFISIPLDLFFNNINSKWCIYALGGTFLTIQRIKAYNIKIYNELLNIIKLNLYNMIQLNTNNYEINKALFFIISFIVDDIPNFIVDVDITLNFLLTILLDHFNKMIPKYNNSNNEFDFNHFYNMEKDNLQNSIGKGSKLIGLLLKEANKVNFNQSISSLFNTNNTITNNKIIILLEMYLKLSEGIYLEWDNYFNSNDYKQFQQHELFSKIQKSLRMIPFSLVFIILQNYQNSSILPSDLELQILFLCFQKFNFIFHLENNNIIFENHFNLHNLMFNWIKQRKNLLIIMLDKLYPYQTLYKIPYELGLTAEPKLNILMQSKELYYLKFLENVMSELSTEQIEVFVLPIIEPYLKNRFEWSNSLYEASHLVVLSLLKYHQSDLVLKFIIWYQKQIIKQYPDWLNQQQFILIYTLLIEGLLNQKDIPNIIIWNNILYLKNNIKNLKQPKDITYLLTYINVYTKVPLIFIKDYFINLQSILKGTSADKVLKFKIQQKLLDLFSKEDLDLSHRDYLLNSYLKFIR